MQCRWISPWGPLRAGAKNSQLLAVHPKGSFSCIHFACYVFNAVGSLPRSSCRFYMLAALFMPLIYLQMYDPSHGEREGETDAERDGQREHHNNCLPVQSHTCELAARWPCSARSAPSYWYTIESGHFSVSAWLWDVPGPPLSLPPFTAATVAAHLSLAIPVTLPWQLKYLSQDGGMCGRTSQREMLCTWKGIKMPSHSVPDCLQCSPWCMNAQFSWGPPLLHPPPMRTMLAWYISYACHVWISSRYGGMSGCR